MQLKLSRLEPISEIARYRKIRRMLQSVKKMLCNWNERNNSNVLLPMFFKETLPLLCSGSEMDAVNIHSSLLIALNRTGVIWLKRMDLRTG